jgi:putative protease
MRTDLKREDIELLAPAGTWEAMRAAVANGANAVYFGVEKFNARARANNFLMEELPQIMEFLHTYGVKGFLTFNILVFENELEDAQELIHACIDAGVDAVIVQDLGLVKMIREISPDFPIHGSTQMTITSPEAVEFTKSYDMERVVLGRENNLKQIKKIADTAKVPLEVFVHGALCVSYSGQCLTSEMWGGRSANRGECAQACRLPYDMMVDGEQKDMGNIAYVLSPKDLNALELVPELIEAGVTSFKIEGRLKAPEYVANVVSKYRKAIDAYFLGVTDYQPDLIDIQELEQSFSRGFTHGFLKGTNNKQLVDGTFPKKRGVYLGRVKKVYRDAILVDLEAPLKRGDGIVFDFGDPTQDEEGGRVYDIRIKGQKIEGGVESGLYEIVMGRNDVDLQNINVGDKVWRTSDMELDRRLRKTFETEKPYRTFPVNLEVYGAVGQPLVTVWTDVQKGHSVTIHSEQPAEEALKRPLDEEILREQFGRLGGTVYELADLHAGLSGNVIVPKSEMNRIRREAVEQLFQLRIEPPKYTKREVDPYEDTSVPEPVDGQEAQLIALCRSLAQIEAAGQTDVDYIYAEFEFVKDYPKAVEAARRLGKKIALATPRILMPGEVSILRQMLKHQPDGILIRNTGAAQFFAQEKPAGVELIGDFSLNIANHKAVNLFLERGLDRVTASYDLNTEQMIDLLSQSRSGQVEVVIHQHMPMFHTEHCVYCTFLSEGTDYTNCGRPCEEQSISLKDRVGMEHPVRVDTGCRNTVYNAVDQSGAEYLGEFLGNGVRCFRVEFLEEEGKRVREVLDLYRKALNGEVSGTDVWRNLNATNQLGVTRGQLTK